MSNVLEIKNLTKYYDGFTLDNISFALPQGSIMGFIGENGAGKSTTIKLILNVIHRDRGEVKIFGRDNLIYDSELKQSVGVVYDESNFPESMTPKNINVILRRIYRNWDQQAFFRYLDQFALPADKELKTFSRGMKMKLSIAVVLSHQAKLLILDEPTSGLDPVVRDEILDIFLDFIQNEEHSIFLSTHITSDIEKIADYIAFIHQGKIVFVAEKDELLNQYGVLKCGFDDFEKLDRRFVKGFRKNRFGVEALVEKQRFKGHVIDAATIEDIMLFYIEGGKTMIGLLINDLFSLKKQWRVLSVITIIYFVFSVASENLGMFSTVSIMYAVILPVTAMAYDEQCRWDKYALSMQLSRSKIVLSKYRIGILLNLGVCILVCLANLVFVYFWDYDLKDVMATAVGISGAGLVILAVMLPILYQFGVEKARLIMVIIFLAPSLLIIMLPNFELTPSPELLSMLPYVLPLLIVGMLLLSIFVSIRIYQRKEF